MTILPSPILTPPGNTCLTGSWSNMRTDTSRHDQTLTDWTPLSDVEPDSTPCSSPSNSTSCDVSCDVSSVSTSCDESSSSSSSSCSSPPSPPGEHRPNYSRAASPVLPPGVQSRNRFQDLVDLGGEDVATFFLRNTHTTMARNKAARPSAPAVVKQTRTVPDSPMKERSPEKADKPNKPNKPDKPDKPKAKPATRTAGGRKLWEFMLHLLCDPATNPSVVRWHDIHQGVFMFVQSRDAASLWGQRRGHPTMTYEHMSRAIRHYYKRHVILRVPGKRLIYQFGPNAHGWRERVRANSTGPLADQLPADFCQVQNPPQPSSVSVSDITQVHSPGHEDPVDEAPTHPATPEDVVTMDTTDNNALPMETVTMATNVNTSMPPPEASATGYGTSMYDVSMDVVTRDQVAMTTDRVQEVPGGAGDYGLNYLHSMHTQQYDTTVTMTSPKSATTNCFPRTQLPSTFDPLDLEFQTGFYEGVIGSDMTDLKPSMVCSAPSKAVPELSDHKPLMGYAQAMAGNTGDLSGVEVDVKPDVQYEMSRSVVVNTEGLLGVEVDMKPYVQCEVMPRSVVSQIQELLLQEQLQELEQNLGRAADMYATAGRDWCTPYCYI